MAESLGCVPVVQRIERVPPKNEIQVQFLSGTPNVVLWRGMAQLVERMVRDREVARSNRATPTTIIVINNLYNRSRMKLHNLRDVYFFWLPKLLILVGILFVLASYGPVLLSECWYLLKTVKRQEYSLTAKTGVRESIFSKYLSTSPVLITPVNTDFALVIEKLDVNAPIVADVSVTDSQAYEKALTNGVAHANSSEYPSEKPSNVYLFAHSSFNFWQLGKYATVFNLLGKLEVGDKIHIFYEAKDYEYAVVNKEIYKGWDTFPLTRPVIEPLLTLQTCDPPGTTLNRLVITAKLTQVH